MPSPMARPLLRLLARTELMSGRITNNHRIGQLCNRSLRGANQTSLKSRRIANLNIGRKSPILNEVSEISGGFRSGVSPRPQRRGYHQHNAYPPESSWQRNKASIVVGSVIGVCCACYVGNWWAQQRAENLHDHRPLKFILRNFVCSLENVREGRWWVVLTSSLSHFTVLHLGANMIAVWSFGPSLVALWGVPAFFGIWVTSELFSSAASLWWDRRRQEARVSSMGRRWDRQEAEKRTWFVPNGGTDDGVTYGGSVGASGAITGMLGAFMCYSPNATVLLWPLPIPFRMWTYTAAFVGWSLYCLDSGTCAWISHAGHLGGLIGGIASYYGAIRPWLRRMPRF